MKRNLLIGALVTLAAACSAPSNESSLVSTEADVNANCFTELNPAGGIAGGKFEEVHFYNGNCADGTRALNKLAMKDDVLVIKGATRERSPLFTDGKQVFVSVDNEQYKIGNLIESKGEQKFDMDQTISFDLMVFDKDGNAKAWKFGDKASYAKEEIAVFL